MPIAPILEVYVVWHPADRDEGPWVANTLISHFRSATYSGLVGGAVDVYVRSEGWRRDGGPPRPIPFIEALPHALPAARFTAVVPVLGPGLSLAVNTDDEWREYVRALVDGSSRIPSVMVFPFASGTVPPRSELAALMGSRAYLRSNGQSDCAALCRLFAQEITSAVGDAAGDELQVFISHTKRTSPFDADDDVLDLLEVVRRRIERAPRLRPFYDDHDIGPGTDFRGVLEANASRSAMLLVRTDRYAGRAWCQHEVVTAKRANMPVVTLYAVERGEERGSFLIDHVPSFPLPRGDRERWPEVIDTALDQLVDEALKRALWTHQVPHLRRAGFAWLPANAPEPLTIAPELVRLLREASDDDPVLVIHPDPPLGSAEFKLLDELAVLAGASPRRLDVLTPRTFAGRGGRLSS